MNKRDVYGVQKDAYGTLISTGRATSILNGSVYYDTNITAAVSTDSGVTPLGVHGRFARFDNTRTRPLTSSDVESYTVALVRGAVTTDCFPLFVPILRPSTPDDPNPVIENGVPIWETMMQPGLALTWTGPVYTESVDAAIQGVVPSLDITLASWPNYGFLPYYTTSRYRVAASFASISRCPDCTVAVLCSRLTSGFPWTVATSATNSQFLTFTNPTTNPIYIDFTMPPVAQFFSNVTTGAVIPSKAGILQACKLLGFIPGQVFIIPASGSATLPRPFQLAFRASVNVFSYKYARWVPEDTSVPVPRAEDVASGYQGTYFDCYTYDHVVNQCINPTFKRLIYDEWDAPTVPLVSPATVLPKDEQCLQRQITTVCTGNCAALQAWQKGVVYAIGNSVLVEGRAFYSQVDNNIGNLPTYGTANPNAFWFDCGPSFHNSWTPTLDYKVGDVVTYIGANTRTTYYVCTANVAASTTFQTASFAAGVAFTRLNNFLGSGASLDGVNFPTIGTAAPTVSFNSSSQLFTLNLDSYGFGGTDATNAYDGYSVIDDSLYPTAGVEEFILNSSLNDQARDSWGLTGTTLNNAAPNLTAYTTFRHPGTVFDERFTVESDDYFNQLFGNWPLLRLNYLDPRTNMVTSYVRYVVQAANAGLTVPTPLPLVDPTVATTGYLPITRVAGNQPYLYTFTQSYPSVGLMWNPVDTIVVVTTKVPVLAAQTLPPYVIGNDGSAPSKTIANTENILGEFVVRGVTGQSGQEFRNQIVFEPQTLNRIDLLRGINFINFDFELKMRMKGTQLLRPVTLSNGGSVNIRWHFELKT